MVKPMLMQHKKTDLKRHAPKTLKQIPPLLQPVRKWKDLSSTLGVRQTLQ
jgi:hypothetical protein